MDELRLLAGLVAAGVIAVLLLGAVVIGSFWLDPAPHWVVSAKGTVLSIQRFQADYLRAHESYAPAQELGRLRILPPNGCDDVYCYTYEAVPNGYTIRARPTAFRRSICWITRTKWPTFYADQTGIIRQSTGPELASATSAPIPVGGGW